LELRNWAARIREPGFCGKLDGLMLVDLARKRAEAGFAESEMESLVANLRRELASVRSDMADLEAELAAACRRIADLDLLPLPGDDPLRGSSS
jgi:hypothetical protein